MRVSRPLQVVLSLMFVFTSPNVRADNPRSPVEYGLDVGKKMPFHVADFVNGKAKNHCGCPSVMSANASGRGLIIWSRGTVEPAFKLAKALDAGTADSDKLERFLVIFDADAKALSKQAAGLSRVIVGKARLPAKEEFDRRGVEAKVLVLVFLLDKKVVKSKWSFAAGELSEEKVKEIAAAATSFSGGIK